MKKETGKKIIIVNFCLAAILALIAISLAAYTSLSSAKRVVSTTSTDQLFSSNVLYAYKANQESPSTRAMSFSASGDNLFQFNVCNYAQGDKTTWATKDISYVLSVKLLDSSGNAVTDSDVLSAYQLDGKSFASLASNNQITINKTLTYSAAKVAEDTYTVTVPSKYMSDYKILITAECNISQYDPIGRLILTTESSVSTHWRGTFTDSIVGSAAHKPSELGSINTRISGQENEIMVISWDTNYVEIDPWFLEDIGSKNYTIKTDSSTGVKIMQFEVGGENQPSQYQISFYRTTSAKSLDETWEEMKKHIYFGYLSKSTTETGGENK
jgi:hypothetical protein